MKNGYALLCLLQSKLENSVPYLLKTSKMTKDRFVGNDMLLNTGIGLINELGEIISSLDENIFLINKPLYDTLIPIKNYSSSLLNKSCLVNGYKLYDCITIDLVNANSLINNLIKKDNF